MIKNKKKYFDNFVINYTPWKWENQNEKRILYKDKSSVLVSYTRFLKVFNYLTKIREEIPGEIKIIDVGAFPGNMVKLTRDLFKNISQHVAIGLGFEKEFIDELTKLNIKCIDTEMDPAFEKAKEIKNWNLKNFDLCLLLDTIEHLIEPNFCLDQINKSLRKEGFLILTTDNITNFLYIQEMLRKGKSPNVPYVLSSKVFTGDWRPHHREFSKHELNYLLSYSGFKIIKHEYFDRKQGEHKLNREKNKIINHRYKWGIKHGIFLAAKNLAYCIPHLRNHQILLAKKINEIDEIKNLRIKTESKEEWLKIRSSQGY